MATLDITYEDGLRLSELYGQLESLKYEAANMLAVHAGALLVATVATILVALFLCWVMRDVMDILPGTTRFESEAQAKKRQGRGLLYRYEVVKDAGTRTVQDSYYDRSHLKWINYEKTETVPMEVVWRPTPFYHVCRLWPVLIPFIVMPIIWVTLNAGVEMDLASVQGQIDAILAKYGMLE